MKTITILKITVLAGVFCIGMAAQSEANDVQVKIPESSLQIVIDQMIEARAFSFGSTSSKAGVNYYGYLPRQAVLNILPGNEFTLTITGKAIANFQLGPFGFGLPGLNNQVIVVEGSISIQNQGSGYKLTLIPDDFTDQTGNWLSGAINLASLLVKLPEISTSAELPLLADATTSFFTSATPSLTTTDDEVIFGYTLKNGPRYITVQNRVNGEPNIGSVQKVAGSTITTHDSPHTFEQNMGTTIQVQTPQELLDDGGEKHKYSLWEDQTGQTQSEIATRRIQHQVDADETLSAVFNRARRIQLSNSLEGSLSGGTITYDGTTTSSFDDYDYLNALDHKTINSSVPNGTQGTNWTFWKWSDGNTNKQRNLIINQNYDLEALYKGSQLSNNTNTFKASQRKVVRTSNGWEHQVYESMGHIWYEAKPPSGNWEFVPRNNTTNSPLNLDTSGGKTPSIDRSSSDDESMNGGDEFTVMAWQEGSQIKMHRYFRPGGTGNAYQKYGSTLTISPGQGSSYELQPAVAWSSGRYFGIFYRSSSGIKYKFYKVDGTAGESGTVPGTSGAERFAVDTYHDGSSDIFAVAFEKPVSSPSGAKQIRLNYISYDHANDDADDVYTNSFLISSGSYPYNRIPSVAVTDDEMSVGWVSTNSSSWSPANTKATVAHITFPGGSFHVSRSVFSSYVRSVSLAKLDDNSEYYAAWNSLYSTSPYYPPYAFHFNYTAKGSALSTVKTLNTNGWDLQLYDAFSKNNMQAVAFTPTHASTAFTTPYYWERSNSLGTYLKAKPLTTTRGRGVSLSDSAGTVTFAIHNLMVDEQQVQFVPMESGEGTVKAHMKQPRPLNVRQSLGQVQPLLVSQPFTVNSSSEISFEESIMFSDSLAVLKRLGKNGRITVKAELVEAGTGKPVATLRERTLSGKDGISSFNQAWKVDPKKLKETTVQVVLTVTTNLNELQAVAEDYFEDYEMLEKMNPDRQKAYKELRAEPAEEITEYGLAQNYPNPFNPSTVIRYQLPENSMVRLEVFDLLGRKVATLVNERQSTGKYSVRFDAGHLASGVYLYRLQAGEFVQSKKLFLIK